MQNHSYKPTDHEANDCVNVDNHKIRYSQHSTICLHEIGPFRHSETFKPFLGHQGPLLGTSRGVGGLFGVHMGVKGLFWTKLGPIHGVRSLLWVQAWGRRQVFLVFQVSRVFRTGILGFLDIEWGDDHGCLYMKPKQHSTY